MIYCRAKVPRVSRPSISIDVHPHLTACRNSISVVDKYNPILHMPTRFRSRTNSVFVYSPEPKDEFVDDASSTGSRTPRKSRSVENVASIAVSSANAENSSASRLASAASCVSGGSRGMLTVAARGMGERRASASAVSFVRPAAPKARPAAYPKLLPYPGLNLLSMKRQRDSLSSVSIKCVINR